MVSTGDVHESLFAEHRAFLYSIAYRMLGSAADAEDLVQDLYLRWSETPVESVEAPKAYLASAITRLCMNHLRSARVRREAYVGPWLPEPLLTSGSPDPAELAESLTLAFLVLLESLSPVERAVFLLSEVFGYDAEEIAGMVEKSPANCRQILHRARGAVAERKHRYAVPKASVEPLLRSFGEAVYGGDISGLLSMLHENAVVWTDGGGKAPAALNPIRGADRCARFLIGAAAKGGARLHTVPAEINRQPGFVNYLGGEIVSTLVFDIADDKILAIYITVNPDKLRNLKEAQEHAQDDC